MIGDAAPSPCNASAVECSSAAPLAASIGSSPAAGASTATAKSHPPCEGLSAAAPSQQQQQQQQQQQRHPQQQQQQRHPQQHCRQQVLVYGGFSGTQVEGSLLIIDVQNLEVTAVGKASKAASTDASGKLRGQSQSSTSCQPAERFAHCAAAVTLPQCKASTGRAKVSSDQLLRPCGTGSFCGYIRTSTMQDMLPQLLHCQPYRVFDPVVSHK